MKKSTVKKAGGPGKPALPKDAVPNVAYDIERPLFKKGDNWDYLAFKHNLLSKPTNEEKTKLPDLHFFDGEATHDNEPECTVMTSFPRSGNTLLRATIEKIGGLVTGSDCDITKKLNVALMDMGLAGEGLVDKRVWVTKTHYPERYGKSKFLTSRAILLIRNPLDSIASLFNMVCSGTHDLSIADDDFVKVASLWHDFMM